MKKIAAISFIITLSSFASKVSFDANVEELYAVFKKKRVKNVASAIQMLDDHFFSKDQYAVIFDSRSIQASSYDYPRILLFGRNKKIGIGINHHLGDERNLEIIQFRSKEKVWELREIKFNDEGVFLSKANPSQCISCHGDRDIVPNFKGRVDQANKYTMDFLRKGKRPDISRFKKMIEKDPIYSRLKNLPSYLRDLGL